jgi:hypothetical protein
VPVAAVQSAALPRGPHKPFAIDWSEHMILFSHQTSAYPVAAAYGKRTLSVVGGGPQVAEEVVATHMSLSNTLTRRCLAEGSKMLFVADVMCVLRGPHMDAKAPRARSPWRVRPAAATRLAAGAPVLKSPPCVVSACRAALRKYGEPWKDVFMEGTRVTNPTWCVAWRASMGCHPWRAARVDLWGERSAVCGWPVS